MCTTKRERDVLEEMRVARGEAGAARASQISMAAPPRIGGDLVGGIPEHLARYDYYERFSLRCACVLTTTYRYNFLPLPKPPDTF
jgi:hypothetical protein